MPSPVNPNEHKRKNRGVVMPIGGAEDKVSDRAILSRFVDICGGRDAVISVIPTASQLDDTGARYHALFNEIGVKGVHVVHPTDRVEADREDWLEALETSTGIFFTGGNQLRLSTILGGTEMATRIRRLNARGVHVAGTSAGAAFVSEHMIAFGREGATPHAGQVTLSPGLGLSNRVIVDQHFRERDRLGRLLTALAYSPFAVGIGLDEDTAAVIDNKNCIEVVGNGGITVVDVSDLEYSSMAYAEEGEVVELTGIRLHVLAHGGRYDLEAKRAYAGSAK